jgi:Zn finger protein HypA/HybF involved in hydrogenase expression
MEGASFEEEHFELKQKIVGELMEKELKKPKTCVHCQTVFFTKNPQLLCPQCGKDDDIVERLIASWKH